MIAFLRKLFRPASVSQRRSAAAHSPHPEAIPSRIVISWFGWDIRALESFTDHDCQLWADELHRICLDNGFSVERLGNPIDVIVGIPGRDVRPHDYYRFQKLFEDLNERLGWHMSAILCLSDASQKSGKSPQIDPIYERYEDGKKVSGDSIGRPYRHSLLALRHREQANGQPAQK